MVTASTGTAALNIMLTAISLAGAVAAFVSVVYIARNKAIIDNYRVTVESQNARIATQEKRIAELECQVNKLQGCNEGHRMAARLWVEAITASGVCRKAWECGDRELPRPEGVQAGF